MRVVFLLLFPLQFQIQQIWNFFFLYDHAFEWTLLRIVTLWILFKFSDYFFVCSFICCFKWCIDSCENINISFDPSNDEEFLILQMMKNFEHSVYDMQNATIVVVLNSCSSVKFINESASNSSSMFFFFFINVGLKCWLWLLFFLDFHRCRIEMLTLVSFFAYSLLSNLLAPFWKKCIQVADVEIR